MFRDAYKNEGGLWFRRLLKDLKKISRHIRVKRIKHGFFRIYYKQAYIHEVYKEMPQVGYDFEHYDYRYEDKSFWEEKEDRADLTRNIKNYVEGYWDSINTIRTRVWLFKHNEEFYQTAVKGYQQIVIK